MKIKNKFIFGEYNRSGFVIFLVHNGDVSELHQEGNHKLDSYQSAPLNSKFALPLRKIRAFTIKTGRELAQEHHAKWNGVERIND
jgi:hypothetical protein